MTRGGLLLLGLGLAGAIALALLGAAGRPVLPSYLAAWLFVLACPLGALPLVMAHDLLHRPDSPTTATLRTLLPLTPLAALMAVPLVLQRAALYPTAATTGGFAGAWMTPGAILLRGAIAGLLWLGLAALFRRAPDARRAPTRRVLAGAGLLLHLVVGTLIVGDWVAAVDPALNSSSLGLTVLVAQAGIALSVAVLLAAPVPPARGLAQAVLWLFGGWLFLSFTQYLVVWSANLPAEVPWYLSRDGGLGGAAEAGAAIVFLVALVVLSRAPGRPALVGIAAAILAVHLVAMFWLVVPAARGRFDVTPADAAAALGLAGLAAALALALRPVAVASSEGRR